MIDPPILKVPMQLTRPPPPQGPRGNPPIDVAVVIRSLAQLERVLGH